MITVKAKPLSDRKRIKFDQNRIIQVYYGRLDNCRCGCAGEYYKPGESETSDNVINHALAQLQLYAERDEVLYDRFTYTTDYPDELYLEFQTEMRTLHSDYDEDYDDWGEDDEEEAQYGYAFYINDEDWVDYPK